MALADSVPGVSGGTIAFLLGCYDDFIGSLDAFVPGGSSKDERKSKIKTALKFLSKLGVGWIIGFVSAVLVLTSIFEAHIYQISSLFLGFIIFSIPLIIKEEWTTIKSKYYNLIFTLIGAGLVVLITVLNPSGGGDAAVTAESVNILDYLFYTMTGMLGISAMVLPGISGSTILLIFGTYMPIMTAIKDVLHFNFSMETILKVGFFGVGVILGILLVIRLVKRSLEKFRSQTVYAIIGLMLGSLYAVVMGPQSLDTPQPAMTTNTFSILFFIIGGAVIFGLQLMQYFMEKRKK
ncbi:MAG: DUF368 domain-containing protein [Oscillospiraceae bacterium]|nr:DUF368 domain-containing protein [Oscillospiraceae bacterium]